MTPRERSASDESLQECQMRSCDRIARVSASANANDWYNLCHPCCDAFSQAGSDVGAGVSMVMPPYDGATLELCRESRTQPD